ncbi:MAG: hypothetical protein WDA59_05475 [Methanofastidiosum sp.]|jgi:hypothetical protein
MRLNFLNPEVQKGLNSTVRLGERNEFQPGLELEIFETDKDVQISKAVVTEVKQKPYWKVTNYDLRFQHDIETRKLPGLEEAMIRAYGDKIKSDSIVTIVYFKVE